MAATSSPAPVTPTIDSDLAGASSGPLADPGAWAVTAFATTSFMLGLYNTHLIGQGSLPIVFPVAFFFGGMIQILVGILEVGRGNVFGAVVFGTYGPFWVIYAAIQTWFAKMASPASSVDAGVALFLAMFAVLTFFFLLASLRTDRVLVAIFALIFLALILLAIGAQSGAIGWTKIGGWVVIIFAVLAWYHAAADIINFTFGRRVLSVGKITA